MTLPEPVLERFRRGELSPAEHAALEAQLSLEDHARLEELDASDAEILSRYPPRVMAIAIRERSRRRARRLVVPFVGSAVVMLGAGAALMFALSSRDIMTPPPTGMSDGIRDDGSVRAKGDTRVMVYSARQPDVPLGQGAEANAGEVLQLALNAGVDRYAVLVSIDGAGVVTPHLPARGDVAAKVEPGRTIALPHAYKLDDAPAFERFFLVTASEPFSAAQVIEAADRVAASAEPGSAPLAPSLDVDYTVADHLIVKGTP